VGNEENEVKVEDRRFFDKEGNPIREESKEGPAPQSSHPQEERPKIDFASFLFIYVQTALVHLGDIEDPVERKAKENFEGARQIIDILEMLQEKTRGNLSKEETQYFEQILFDLRMRFVEKAGKAR